MRRPCSSHVYQVSDTPASIATSSRRSPGVRRPRPARQPDLLGSSPPRDGPAGTRRARRDGRSSSMSQSSRDERPVDLGIRFAACSAFPRVRRSRSTRCSTISARSSRSSRRRTTSTRSRSRPRSLAAIIEARLGADGDAHRRPGRPARALVGRRRAEGAPARPPRHGVPARHAGRPTVRRSPTAGSPGPGVFDMKGGIVQAIHGLSPRSTIPSRCRAAVHAPTRRSVRSTSRALLEERAMACGAVLVLEPQRRRRCC